MKPKILMWNVRRLNKIKKRLEIRGLLRDWKADVVCLVETKMAVISREVVRSLWGCHYVDWCYMEASGASGGILLMWDRRVVEKVEECVGRYIVTCSLHNTGDNVVWAFGGVYGPNDDRDRRELWDEFAWLMSWWELPRCIGGDFNVVRFPSEVKSCRHFCSNGRVFRLHIHAEFGGSTA
jgi:exonuclease III